MLRLTAITKAVSTHLVWLVALALVLNIVRLQLHHRDEEARRMRIVHIPYTVRLHETVTTRTGATRDGSDFITASRSDGAFARRIETVNSGEQSVRRFIRFADGTSLFVDDFLERKIVSKHEVWKSIRDPTTLCMKSYSGDPIVTSVVYDGSEVVSGHQTARLKMGGVTQWVALDLNCAVLQQRAWLAEGGFSEQRAVYIDMAEPSSALFDVPDHYKMVETFRYIPRQ